MFRRTVVLKFINSKKAMRPLEMLVTFYHSVLSNITDDLNLQQHLCENLRYRMFSAYYCVYK